MFFNLRNFNLRINKWIQNYSNSFFAATSARKTSCLKTRRKYVVVIIFTAAAILTPPDPITQIGLAIPLLILYELSILSVSLIEKKSKENAQH